MRHRKKKTVTFETGAQKRDIVVRNLLTSLVLHGQIKTSQKKAKVLKSVADSFFSRVVGYHDGKLAEKDATREADRYIKSRMTSDVAGKKIKHELLPRYKSNGQESFVATYNLGFRPGDAAMKVLVKLI